MTSSRASPLVESRSLQCDGPTLPEGGQGLPVPGSIGLPRPR
jgi:hypothetical protein